MFRRIGRAIKRFFIPPAGSPRWAYILPYGVLGVLTLLVLIGGAYGWEYTNSPPFCGAVCHTMPPEYAAYQISPHARVACVECHIGREFVGNQLLRKTGDIRHIVANTFKTYEYPIFTKGMRPARETCERCHSPEKFSDDSLRTITHYKNDDRNTSYLIYLVLHTGGGSKREGLGRGIHWHIENPIMFYTTDRAQQVIPYVRVYNEDGSYTAYTDIESDFDPATLDESRLEEMDCITCHNRITHRVFLPEESIDNALAQGLIDPAIPQIRRQAVLVLSQEYALQEEARLNIAGLRDLYRDNFPDYYADNQEKIDQAVAVIQQIYMQSVFPDQLVDWNTHPNNIGHMNFPGCFRCHDGTHLNTEQEAIRLECNLCHSIPVVASSQDFLVDVEISRGPEPQSHLNPNWIGLHRDVFDTTCANCHTTQDAGGISNTSFCSNSACHGNVYTFAGFDAPSLRLILQSQLPTPQPAPTLAPVIGTPSFTANILPIFVARCSLCHNATNPSAGLDLSSYSGVMAGSSNGPVIVAGSAATSLLIQKQGKQHFANLPPEELELVSEWIDAGAPGQ